MEDFCRHRINGALLANYQGKHVCLLGKAKDVDSSGMYFTLTTCDQRDVRIKMKMPLNEYVAGLTEVHGTVQGRSIACENYIVFPPEASDKFDMSLYNQAVQLVEKYPQHYIQGVGEPQ